MQAGATAGSGSSAPCTLSSEWRCLAHPSSLAQSTELSAGGACSSRIGLPVLPLHRTH